MKSLCTRTLPTGVLIAALSGAAPAWAALGGGATSIEADRAQLKGVLAVSSAGAYEVREITIAGGGLVRQYLTTDGRVFAVSWRGPTIPDLRVLLGAYYPRYAQVATAAAHSGSRRQFAVAQPGLVVESSGRLRAFVGRAWDPTLLPRDFSSDQIR